MGNSFEKDYEYTDPSTGKRKVVSLIPDGNLGVRDLKEAGIIKEARPLHKDDMRKGWAGLTDMKGNVYNARACYLTTATMENQPDFKDNCYELEKMREFRDTDLMATPEGREFITHYKNIAPEIVAKVNTMENASEVWNETYGKIQSIISDLQIGDKNSAFNRYLNMTRDLELL